MALKRGCALLTSPVSRAIFVDGWSSQEPIREPSSRESIMLEIRSIRPHHNFSPPNVAQAVAPALRRNVEESELDRVLLTLPAAARDSWSDMG
ncbi:TPA: DUF2267 domain-containing protein [Stenotrophomonas maltophilia]